MGLIQARKSSERSPGSNRSFGPVGAESCLLPPSRRLDQCGCFFPRGTRCIIDGWLIGNSITQRLLGWQTVGQRYPVRTIELEHRREREVSFRDASPLPADLLRIPKGHSLVHSLTDDLPSNCSCSRPASWPRNAAWRCGTFYGEPASGQVLQVVHFLAAVCGRSERFCMGLHALTFAFSSI